MEGKWGKAQLLEKACWASVDIRDPQYKISKANYWKRILAEIPKRILKLSPNDIILDVGCGPLGIINFVPRGKKIGLDPLIDFYEACNAEHSKEILWKKGTIEDFDFPRESISLVFMMNSLDHVKNPRAAVNKITNLLQEEGHVILSVDCFNSFFFKNYFKIFSIEPVHPHQFTVQDVLNYFSHDFECLKIINVDKHLLSISLEIPRKVKLVLPKIEPKRILYLPFLSLVWVLDKCQILLVRATRSKNLLQKPIISHHLFIFKKSKTSSQGF